MVKTFFTDENRAVLAFELAHLDTVPSMTGRALGTIVRHLLKAHDEQTTALMDSYHENRELRRRNCELEPIGDEPEHRLIGAELAARERVDFIRTAATAAMIKTFPDGSGPSATECWLIAVELWRTKPEDC